jgi:hypothetical protein
LVVAVAAKRRVGSGPAAEVVRNGAAREPIGGTAPITFSMPEMVSADPKPSLAAVEAPRSTMTGAVAADRSRVSVPPAPATVSAPGPKVKTLSPSFPLALSAATESTMRNGAVPSSVTAIPSARVSAIPVFVA